MVLVGVRIDSRDHAASEIRHPSSHRPFGSGAAGRDRADTTVTRHLQQTGTYQATTPPDRPPTTAGNGRPPEPTPPFNDTPRSVRKQVRSRPAPVRRSSLFANSARLFRPGCLAGFSALLLSSREDCLVWSFVYLAVRNVFTLVWLLARPRRSKGALRSWCCAMNSRCSVG